MSSVLVHGERSSEGVLVAVSAVGAGVSTALVLMGAWLGDPRLLDIGSGGMVIGLVLFVVSVFWSRPIVAADEDAAPVAVLRCVACGSDALVSNHGGALVCEMCHARHGMKGVA